MDLNVRFAGGNWLGRISAPEPAGAGNAGGNASTRGIAGFRFARDKIEASAALQTRIGKVSDVSFPIFSRYSAHYGVGCSKIHMELNAKGDRGVANVKLDIAEDDGGFWKIERSSVDGDSMVLDQ